jgi:hypothetical protein
MRKEDINKLSEPYINNKEIIDRRFNSSIGADVPSAGKLAVEIFNDFDVNDFGISWWKSIPKEEGILIGDYLFQCVNSLETNLVEAKLHYFEWLDAVEKTNNRIADIAQRDAFGKIEFKHPKAISASDELASKLFELHLCGFFRAIGSTLDCVGALIIGVLALPKYKNKTLRNASIKSAQECLNAIVDDGTSSSQIQIKFKDFFENVKKVSGPTHWLDWADQYRNMYVHRGRRLVLSELVPKEHLFFEPNNRFLIPRHKRITHLAKFPDRSDIEAFIKSNEITLSEDAEITISGLFKSCRSFCEEISAELLSIWHFRRSNPNLLEQPKNQWDNKIKNCEFDGFLPNENPKIESKQIMQGTPNLLKRMRSAAVLDSKRKFWENSPWR